MQTKKQILMRFKFDTRKGDRIYHPRSQRSSFMVLALQKVAVTEILVEN